MLVEVRSESGTFLFEWKPENQLVNVIRKDMYYSVELRNDSYCIREVCPKYNVTSKSKPTK